MRLGILSAVLRSPGLRRIAIAFGVFSMAEHATWIAMLVFAYGRGGATEAGLIALAMLIPAAAVAPIAATAADRYPRHRVLVAAYLIQAVTIGVTGVVLVAGAPALAAYSAAVLAGTSIVLTRPAQGAMLPHLARTPDELTAANVVIGTVEALAILVGPAIAGLLLAVANPGAVFLAFGVLLAASAVLMAGLRELGATEPQAELEPEAAPAGERASSSVLAGFRTLREQPGPRLVVAVVASAWVLWGAVDIFAVMLAVDLLGLGEGGAGFLIAAIGAGGLLGSFGSLALVGRRRLTVPLLVGLALWGLPLAAVGLLPSVGLAFVFVTIGGALRSILDAAGRTLLQRVSTDDVLASILGVLEGLQMAALALGSVAAPLLVGAFGPRGALIAAGLFLPAVALLAWRRLRAIDTGVVAPDEWIAALRALPMFRALAPAVIEQLAAGAAASTVPPGSVIIREGDPGDAYHVIRRGEVQVTIGGRTIRTQRPGEGFGEIALLRDVPRTATVRSLTEVELLSLNRDSFLLALTGHRDSRRAAELVVDARLRGDAPAP